MYSIDLTELFGQRFIDFVTDFVYNLEHMEPAELLLALVSFNFGVFMFGYVALMLLSQALYPLWMALNVLLSLIGTGH